MMYRPIFPHVYLLIGEVFQLDPNQLPSNTLIIKLSPLGQAFYLPSATNHDSRCSSPSVGYTSDPESEIRKAKQATSADGTAPSVEIVSLSRRRRQKRIDSISYFRDTTKTAEYQELFKFVTRLSVFQVLYLTKFQDSLLFSLAYWTTSLR
jgi:hypothetical protein